MFLDTNAGENAWDDQRKQNKQRRCRKVLSFNVKMDITKGSLDSISRPASCERSRVGSRISYVPPQERGRIIHPNTGSLVVLSPDVPEVQDWIPENDGSPACSEDIPQSLLDFAPVHPITTQAEDSEDSFPPVSHFSETEPCANGYNEESEDPEIQKGMIKMNKLDKILLQRISKEKEVKKQGKELHWKLWEEIQELKSEETPEHEEEAENTRLFLALTPSILCSGEEVDCDPVFETQIPHDQCNTDVSYWKESKSGHSKTADSSKLGYEDMMADQSESRQCGVSRGKKKQDFVKKNIELAKDAGSQVLMTDAEKARLAEILQDMDDGDEKDQWDSSLSALPVPAGQGYTPEPAELDQLQHIDSRLQLLLPVEDFLSLRSNYPDHSLLESSRAGWDIEGDGLPGEKVLLDMKATREQEMRLREIEQQLEQIQSSTCETPILLEGQLSSLLEECVVALSRMPSVLTGSGHMSPRASLDCPSSPCSLLESTPRLSDSALSELLKSATVHRGHR
ncbi:hypothetical protein AGOR_G00106600 [Albula goreensis]|uniref:Fibrous sheath-interacting protein 1 n=1 Tax=Albula goreensis TaxID=1534307 RepID=A0A8T3DHI1_9TELE|nr:hypothetical protein AGOR_G00106600 [Albula goreensis]